ncbi:hypothetical protein FTM89_03380 [Chlamydia trachomatis]|uniref:Uncharacterized protein n=2 Tax=Chlamydia muridarum TaxID=83560 RepID=Q9PK37_CHLMU|nr:hypothetical protein [Chlamydia muridarum]UFT44024.1 hypothetical protein FTN72_03395 [Chlamydia trachomatis]AAF39465.1 hypothetical protein TC_0636 [Chlamydia muridarum str. Nigg]AHH23022.1 putative inclusion membrane protein [Chlamydia muridarum str. Nigg3 CMUT3-5]AHH23947.1 putative inclusion membrane protein [Chlamydia muridarum str. Nigg CM972]AID38154.1 putative inclusion membrane protein [Chlamydia muridarum str. Nigg 2 MCR]
MPVIQKPLVSEQAPVSYSQSSEQKIQNSKSRITCSKVSAILALSLLAIGIIATVALFTSTGCLAYVLVAGILALHVIITLSLCLWITSSASTQQSLQNKEPGKELI